MELHKEREMSEVRKNRRLPMEPPVGVAIVSGFWNRFMGRPQFEGSVKNASMSGIRLYVERTVPDKAALMLWIQVHAGTQVRTLKLLGDVVWVKPDTKPGAFLVGIRLRDQPKEPMKVWTDTMLDEIRHHGGSDMHY